MRYIQKTTAPEAFSQEIADFTVDTAWNELHCKPALREYLRQEQYQLCAYCEGKLEDNNSHIEHIEPQERNPQRRFDYQNLIASCNGGEECCADELKPSYAQLDIQSCGHRKSNAFEPDLFLNPVEVREISDYFAYDCHSGMIQCNENQSPAKANYMIDLLHLDSVYLCHSRLNARTALIKAIKRSGKKPQQALPKLLAKPRPFMSFLQACFKP